MEQAIPVSELEPEHIVEIVVHISETLEEKQRLNFIAALENDERKAGRSGLDIRKSVITEIFHLPRPTHVSHHFHRGRENRYGCS